MMVFARSSYSPRGLSSCDISLQSAVLATPGEGYFFKNSQRTGMAILPRRNVNGKVYNDFLFLPHKVDISLCVKWC